ncbi:unnamed protein product [Arctia plantaginis]|uniref:Uncharacterized protein n=1 Tax=Arctia plantaginis TaxID=874455 RepID=A0A8S0ZS67_ARCPL|nr:unnamed protein product [Arctia plantaginis]
MTSVSFPRITELITKLYFIVLTVFGGAAVARLRDTHHHNCCIHALAHSRTHSRSPSSAPCNSSGVELPAPSRPHAIALHSGTLRCVRKKRTQEARGAVW